MKERTTLSLPSKSINQTVSGLEALDMDKLDGDIWKFMSDYKKRTVHEIRHAIVLLGYPLPIVDRRLDSIFAKKWFDRNGERGNDIKYTLKKHVKNPAKEKIMQEKESEIPAPQARRTIGTMLVGSIAKTLAGAQPASQESASSLFVEVKPAINTSVDHTPVDMPHAMMSGAPVAPTATENVPCYTVEKDDPVRVAIWKVCRDGQTYTLQELHLLLDHITLSSLRVNLHDMAEQGLFFTNRKDKKSPIVYRMLADVPMPEGGVPYKRRTAEVEDVQPEPKSEDKPVEPVAPAAQPEQQPAAQPQESNVSTNNNPAAASPLFSMTAAIRGQEFTLQELRAIKADLIACNLIRTDARDPVFSCDRVKTIEFKATIKGMDFTVDELRELAKELATI